MSEASQPFVLDGYRPGSLAAIVGMHTSWYSQAWGFGLAFEAKVAQELAAFLTHMDNSRDLHLTAWRGDALVGTVTLDVTGGGPGGAHLRWFIVTPQAQGAGLGKRLLDRAIAHCDRHARGRAWLTTFSGLDSARRLYETAGFRLMHETDADQWSGGVREQFFQREGALV